MFEFQFGDALAAFEVRRGCGFFAVLAGAAFLVADYSIGFFFAGELFAFDAGDESLLQCAGFVEFAEEGSEFGRIVFQEVAGLSNALDGGVVLELGVGGEDDIGAGIGERDSGELGFESGLEVGEEIGGGSTEEKVLSAGCGVLIGGGK